MNITYPIETCAKQIELGYPVSFIETVLLDNIISKIRIDLCLNSFEKYVKFGAKPDRFSKNALKATNTDNIMIVGIRCIDDAKAKEVETNIRATIVKEAEGSLLPTFSIIRPVYQSSSVQNYPFRI